MMKLFDYEGGFMKTATIRKRMRYTIFLYLIVPLMNCPSPRIIQEF